MMILHKMECDPFMWAYYTHTLYIVNIKITRITLWLIFYMGIRKITAGSEAVFTFASMNASLVVFSTFCLVSLHVTFFYPVSVIFFIRIKDRMGPLLILSVVHTVVIGTMLKKW